MSGRRYHKFTEGDKFETEAFEYLNEEFDAKPKKIKDDEESDVELAGIKLDFHWHNKLLEVSIPGC